MAFRVFSKLLQLIIAGLIGLLVLACILFSVLQSKWGKEQIKNQVLSYLEKAGITATIEDLNGQLPFSWTLREATLSLKAGNTLNLSNVKLRIAILPLLKGRMVIDYLKAGHVTYSYFPSCEEQLPFSLSQSKSLLRQQINQISLPFQIDIHHLNIQQIDIVNLTNCSSFSFSLAGSARIHRNKENFLVDISLSSPDQKMTYLEAFLEGKKADDFIKASLKINLESIPEGLIEDFEAQVACHFYLEGTWTAWEEVIYERPRSVEVLQGEFKALLTNVQVRSAPMFNCDWKFKAEFSVLSPEELYLKKFLVLSELIRAKGKGELNQDFEKSKLIVAFSLPDLSKFNSCCAQSQSWNFAGLLQGKALYQQGTYKMSCQTQDLYIDSFAIGTLRAFLKGSQESNWEADVKLSSVDADVPFESSFSLEYIPEQAFSVIHFNATASEAIAEGHASYDIPSQLCEGSLFVSADHLDQFSTFFPKANLKGSLIAECHLSANQGEQNADCLMIAKSLRFQDFNIDDLTFNVEIENLFNAPEGQFSVLAEKIYTPSFYLDQFTFETQSDIENWPFSLDAKGQLENPFQVHAKGFWQKENSLFSLELTQLLGDLSEIPFSLRYPCELDWGSNYLNLSPIDFQIGEGHLYSVFELSPIRSIAKWDLKHFPLEVLRCLRPRFKLNGFISASGFVDMTEENIEGVVNAILEEADVLHFGKKDPFQAKGTLQAHLNHKMLQVYTDVHATDEQFLDFTASLPIEYCNYPFRITLDEERNTSAELVAEGKLQDLFDFVNLGTNHFTGLLSCRLFLSHTLASPSLQGEFELQSGTYDNYFTGISLRHINAQFEAHNDRIQLIQLQATDEKKGEISAHGKIELKPKEHFPYAFNTELKNLHALGFDMIDCNLTGPLYLNGNTQKMLAQGNLLVDEAKIQITERLPYEVPTLPFTYVNRPPYLYSKNAKTSSGFVFTIDLEVTADKNVRVQGRGLNAELEGNIHLHGANTNIVANGTLKLIKGEYQFVGKIFKLTEGEIIFNDKPASTAYLKLNGTLSLPDVTITAMLSGPLIAPQLTFQSNPQKSTSSILALILFNKDIAEISHAEAIQLASTLVSLSGGAGPDVLEAIRKSIGVDRLNISSKPGTDELAIQIGKYLTRGIMITLSQSATSSQVIVEVELPKGFVFQAETQEEEEGKFSLKWTKSY